jgi:hypothetical protein
LQFIFVCLAVCHYITLFYSDCAFHSYFFNDFSLLLSFLSPTKHSFYTFLFFIHEIQFWFVWWVCHQNETKQNFSPIIKTKYLQYSPHTQNLCLMRRRRSALSDNFIWSKTFELWTFCTLKKTFLIYLLIPSSILCKHKIKKIYGFSWRNLKFWVDCKNDEVIATPLFKKWPRLCMDQMWTYLVHFEIFIIYFFFFLKYG